MSFLPGAAVRKHLNRPSQDDVDLRAACFCHRKIIDVGYVCSICLSSTCSCGSQVKSGSQSRRPVFCAPVPVCTTCKTKFPLSTLKALGGLGGGTAGAARSRPTPNGSSAEGPAKKKRKQNVAATASVAPSPAPSTPASADSGTPAP